MSHAHELRRHAPAATACNSAWACWPAAAWSTCCGLRARPPTQPERSRRAPADELHPHLDGRRPDALRDVRPQAGRSGRDPRRVRADRHEDARRLLLASTCSGWPAIADKFAVVRSIRHDQGNHGAGNHYMMTGAPPRIPVGCGAFVSFHPSLGSVAAYERRRRRAAGLLLDAGRCRAPAGRTSSAPSTPRSSSPTIPNSTDFRVRDVALPAG